MMSKAIKAIRIPVIVSLLAMGGMAQAVNLVTNGSFEDAAAGFVGPTTGNFLSLVSTTFNAGAMDGWTVDVDRLAWIGSPIAAGAGFLVSQNGNRFLDLTDTQAAAPYGGLTTTINTVIGESYLLSYYLGTSQFYNPLDGTAAVVSIAGVNFTTASAMTALPGSWEYKSSTFTALGTTTTISFVGIYGKDYIGLDNVSVTAVPEPMGIALALAGIGIVGMGMGKRRKAS